MKKNLNLAALGVNGRQSELIELALTYRFCSLDVNAEELLNRAAKHGVENAGQFLASAKLKPYGWRLPSDLHAEDAKFANDLAALDALAETAATLGFTVCEVVVPPASDDLPFHENFELCRTRLLRISDVLAKHGICVGITFKAAIEHRAGRAFQFIHTAEEAVTLLKTIGSDNVRLILDTWEWKVGGGSEQCSEISGKQIVAVRLAEVPDDADIEAIADSNRHLPGEASINKFAVLLARLQTEGFTGPVSLCPDPSTFEGTAREANVKSCSELLKQIWAGVESDQAPEVTSEAAAV